MIEYIIIGFIAAVLAAIVVFMQHEGSRPSTLPTGPCVTCSKHF